MTRTIILLSVAMLAGCKDDTPPHWETVCVEQEFSHFMTTLIPSGKVFIPIQIPVYSCVSEKRKCVAGDDFKGERVCK